jgi:hypothetical protein
VPVWLERLALGVLATSFVGLIVLNVLKMSAFQRVTLGIVIVAGSLFIADIVYKRNKPEIAPTATIVPPRFFKVDLIQQIFSGILAGNQDPTFWIVRNDKTVIPIDLFLLLRVVNLQSTPASLDQFKIEMRMRGDRWVEIHDFQSPSFRVYQGLDLRSVLEVSVKPPSVGVVFARAIPPSETKRAIAMCQIPAAELGNVEPGVPRLRVTIVDTKGNTDGPVEVNSNDVRGAWEVSEIRTMQAEDISGFRQERP